MTTHPADVLAASDSAIAVRIALAAVLCRDCNAYVPLGWVDTTAAPRCPATRHSHRAYTEAIVSIKDRIFNEAT